MTERLTLRTWEVRELRAESGTRLEHGVLAVDADGLKGLAGPPIADVEVLLVSPGEPIRMTHVLDAVVPSVKADDPTASYPGILGPVVPAGRGLTNRLSGVAVLSIADYGDLAAAAEVPIEGDSLVDMSGPGSEACPFSAMNNVVLVFRLEPDADPVRADDAMRRATLAVARDLAASTLAAGPPDRVVELELGELDQDLPSIAMILQVASEGPANDTLLYGEPLIRAPARVIEPGELIDGALISAAYDYAGLRNVSAFYQDNALVRRLCAEHGSRLNFAGVVVTLAFLNDPDDKRAWAEDAAALVEGLGADGVIMTSFQSGNSHTDVMLTIRACETRGIPTVAIISETDAGLVDMVPEADALVSSGNEDQLLPAWEPERVIGPNLFVDGTPADRLRPLPVVAYLAAVEQTGSSRVRAVTL
jgi:glycine reductase